MRDGIFRRGLRPMVNIARSVAGTNGLFEKSNCIQTKVDLLEARLTAFEASMSKMADILSELQAINHKLNAPPNCPVCAQGGQFRQVGTNVLRNGIPTPIFECSRCTHKFIYPVPSPEVQLSWYQDIQYHIADLAYQGINSLELNEQWSGYISGRMTPLEQEVMERFGLSGSLRIGEFGCSNGALLKHLALKGHQVVGFEAGTEIATRGAQQYGIEIETGDFELSEPRGRDLDVIMSFHTLEHVREPASVVAHAAAMLREGGCILVEVPCDDQEMNNPEHLHFFSERSLRYLLRNQFCHLKLRPNKYARDGITMTGSMFISGRKV